MIEFPKVMYLTHDGTSFVAQEELPDRAMRGEGLAIYALHQVKRMPPEAALDLKDENKVTALRSDLAGHVTRLRALVTAGDKQGARAELDALSAMLPDRENGQAVVDRHVNELIDALAKPNHKRAKSKPMPRRGSR